MSASILLSIEGGLARLTLNRPAALNAMDFEMGQRWRDAAHEIADDERVGAVVLAGAGRAFCAGGDVVAMATSGATGADIRAMAGVIHDGIRTLVECPKPIVAVVDGPVAGGGLGLMLTADYIVAGTAARFVSRYADIGLTPDLGVSTLLPAAIGQRRALQLLLQDRTLDAEEAQAWGLVTEVAADPAARADEIAASWLAGATAAYGEASRLVREGAERPFAENLADEAVTIAAAFETDGARARIAAFAASRTSAARPSATGSAGAASADGAARSVGDDGPE